MLDLRTGELSPHTPAQRFTHCTTVEYIPQSDTSALRSWLAGAVAGGMETVDWLQMAVGYSLTGHTREEVLFYLYGPPRSGKGTLTEMILALLGSPLAKEVNFATFTAQRSGDSQNFDLAPLKPCRTVLASESNAYERFNKAKVKMLTGGNEVYCAFKHQTHFAVSDETRSIRIAEQNDQFRKRAGLPPADGEDVIPGVALMTAGIRALPLPVQLAILARVREFDTFTPDNDPYGEHDFGIIQVPGEGSVYWKIDYYDPTLTYGSEDPSDLSVTHRVLTILLAEEY